MEQLQPQYTEDQMQKLLDAYRIAKKAFPDEDKEELLNLLDICQQNDGLYVASKAETLMGVFRYDPGSRVGDRKMLDLVKDYDYDVLKALDLRDGDVVHIVGFAAPRGAYQVVRQIIAELNPKAVSTHRFRNGVRYFCLRKNVRWKPENKPDV